MFWMYASRRGAVYTKGKDVSGSLQEGRGEQKEGMASCASVTHGPARSSWCRQQQNRLLLEFSPPYATTCAPTSPTHAHAGAATHTYNAIHV